jgi:TBC1 domain family member 2
VETKVDGEEAASAGASATAEAASAPCGEHAAEAIDSSMDGERAGSAARQARFASLLKAPHTDVRALRKLAWSGVPHKHRAEVWQVLLGYRPADRGIAESRLRARREEYHTSARQHFKVRSGIGRTEPEQKLLRQVLVDVPRTLPSVKLIHADPLQRALERVLYMWALRHPASGYVQGINDIATPLFVVCLACSASALEKDVSTVPKAVLQDAEADVYWCLTRLLDGVQDHYTPEQPGLQRMVREIAHLLKRIEPGLLDHIEAQDFTLMQLIFPWLNCLLLRELPLPLVLRLWDTYFAEGGGEGGAGAGAAGFEHFHVYVCAALLAHFSGDIRSRYKTDVIEFIQALPTMSWGVRDLEELISQAFVYKSSFDGSGLPLG